MKHRLLFLTVIPSPYQQELFNALNCSEEFDISVRYYSDVASDRKWERTQLADYEKVMPVTRLPFVKFRLAVNSGLINEIRNADADLVIVSDYSFVSAQIAMWYLAFKGKKWIYWGEKPGMRRNLFRNILRPLLMLPIQYSAAAVCAIGSRAESYYFTWLHGKKMVFNIPYFCDLHPFQAAEKIRHDRINLLYSGQFIERKGVDTLLNAFALIADECPDLDLIMAGGNAEDIDPDLIPDRLKDRIQFAGFVQPGDLPGLFARADIFVLPSRYDGWGVVINEALGAGLPVIASDATGAAQDLVIHDENGYIFPAGDTHELAACIRKLVKSRTLREKFANASGQLGATFNLDEGVRRWKQACDYILAIDI